MKNSLIFIMCLLIPTSLFAVDITVGASMGLNAGWNTGSDWKNFGTAATQVFGSDIEFSTERKTGFEIGAFCEIEINEFFSLQPEFSFLYTRAGLSGNILFFDIEFAATTKYFEIPVLAKFNHKTPIGKFSVFAGPSFQIMVGDMKIKATSSVASYSESISEKIEPDNKFLIGGILGFGYQLSLGPGILVCDIRYRRQFTGYIDDFNTRGNTIGFRAGYAVPLSFIQKKLKS